MRILMIAMSGVRACDEELLALGLTLPGFVERSETIASLPSLGLLTLAGMTPGEHRVAYRDVEQFVGESADDWPAWAGVCEELGSEPELAAVSTFTAQALEAYAVADALRAAGVKVVMGGLHVTTLPGEALQHADAAMVGEGEICWPNILRDAEAGRMQGVYRSAPKRFDLADAPMPAFELLDMDRYNRITLQTTRGCPMRCAFCASSILLTDAYTSKPVEKVLAEVDAIIARWPRPFLEFADDNSFVNCRHWRQLLPRLAERKTRWFTETDLGIAFDDELLAMMADAGCVEVLIGLESPVEDGLRLLETRGDWKARHLKDYEAGVKNIQSHGIRVNGCFVLGLDGHGPDIFDRVFDAAERYELYDVQITLQTPFPGTPLYKRLKKQGRLTHDGQWERYTLFDVTHEPDGMSATELVDGFRDLAVRLYSDEQTKRRRDTFNRKYRRGRRGTAARSNASSGADLDAKSA